MEKKTLSNWLTNKYLLIIRNEENFAEKKTYSFNYARVLLILAGLSIVFLSLAIYIVTALLDQWFDPRHAQLESDKKLIQLTIKMDSLERSVKSKDLYIENIRKILSGENPRSTDKSEVETVPANTPVLDKIQPVDSQFRAEYEQQEIIQGSLFDGSPITFSANSGELNDVYLFRPMEGIVTDGFNPKKDHYGIDIVSKIGEPVMSVADGVVIMSTWTLDGGYTIAVQHVGSLVSVYKHNSELFKNVGNFVSAGEVIASLGNTGELTSGPHLHLELWHNGNPVNPKEYIAL